MDERDDLPGERDFDPFGGCLDAQIAWRNFGGRTRAEVLEAFRAHPERHQEDFQFMGPVAFLHYFPVLDEYLRTTRVEPGEDEVECATFLAQVLAYQYENAAAALRARMRGPMVALAARVRGRQDELASDAVGREALDVAWASLERILESGSGAPGPSIGTGDRDDRDP